MNPFKCIWNLFGEDWHIPVKSNISSNGTYTQYEIDGDTYFKSLLQVNYTIDIFEELKSTRSLWKIYLIIGLFSECVKSDKKVKEEMLIYSDVKIT